MGTGVSQTHAVVTLHGETLALQTAEEARFYLDAQTKYMSENQFSIASDLREVDRLVFYETLIYRWQSALASGYDNQNNLLTAVDEKDLHKKLSDTSQLVAQIQRNLRLTFDTRSEQANSVGEYLQDLKIRAKQHGVRREKQLGRALELCHELFSIAGAYQRSNESERRRLGFESADDVVAWVMDVMKPQFDEVDEHFRRTQQRFWVRQI